MKSDSRFTSAASEPKRILVIRIVCLATNRVEPLPFLSFIAASDVLSPIRRPTLENFYQCLVLALLGNHPPPSLHKSYINSIPYS